MTAVTVLGTGRMGSAMAERLVEAGHDVVLWNRTPERAAALAERLGCFAAQTPAQAVGDADIVLSVLALGEHTEQVLLDQDLLAALPAGAVVCDMATSGTATADRLATTYREAGIAFVDSPVAGSVASVLSSALVVLASGSVHDVARARSAYEAFSENIVHLGEVGRGQAMKLASVLVVHSLNSAVAESMALATRSGIDPEIAYRVLRSSSAGSPYLAYKEQVFLSEDAPVAMALDLTAKDLGLIAAFAQGLGLELHAMEGVTAEVAAAREAGFGSSDMADLLNYLLDREPPARPTG